MKVGYNMKVVALVGVMAVMCVGGAKDELKFSFTGDFGYIPKNRSVVYENPESYTYVTSDKTFMMMFTPKLDYKFIYGELSVNTISKAPKKNDGPTFCPLRVVWGNELGLYYRFNNNIKISVAWEHNCGHRAVVTTFRQGERLVDNSYDKMFIRFSYSN